MANTEACQVFIEQQIKEGLDEGKTPYSIGQSLLKWLEKLFETKIKPTTIKKRAEREKAKKDLVTNVTKPTETKKVVVEEPAAVAEPEWDEMEELGKIEPCR